jgi:predicted DCC family thiol-disulfide oxidoreductase YuxK
VNTAVSAPALPDPDEHPSTEVVVWDGHCVFCRKQVTRLRELDWQNRLSFLSLHDPRVAVRYPQLSYDQLMAEMWVMARSGEQFGGADSLRYLSRVMPTLWPIAPFLHLPFCMPIWRSLYQWVARRRYRIAGKDCEGGTCQIHAKGK